ncbi:MAG: hypothetical protein R2806_12465 [Saprospiraceae bacterium]
MEIDREGVRYSKLKNNLLIRNSIFDPATSAFWINSTRIDRHWDIGPGSLSGVVVAVLDTNSFRAWLNPVDSPLYGSLNPIPYDRFAFQYSTADTSNIDSILHLLIDVVPEGYYVLVFSVQRGDRSYYPENWLWPSRLFRISLVNYLEEQGATQLNAIRDSLSLPYILFYRKNRGVLNERIAKDIDEWIEISTNVHSIQDQGQLLSSRIGPVQSWNRLEWNARLTKGDTMSIEIIPISDEGIEQQPVRIERANSEGYISLDSITTPYLRFKWINWDMTDFSPPKLRSFRVLYQGLPDLVWNIAKVENAQPIKSGQSFNVEGEYQNLSRTPIGDFKIAASLDKNGLLQTTDTTNHSGLSAFGKGSVRINLSGPLLGGNYIWKAQLNPAGENQRKEVGFENNASVGSLLVEGDKIAPILDVTFDGKYVPDQGIVSPNR